MLRSSRAGVVTAESVQKCFEERGHGISSTRDECWFCGYKFTEEEATKRRDDDRRRNLKVMK